MVLNEHKKKLDRERTRIEEDCQEKLSKEKDKEKRKNKQVTQ
jgi:hypothetical protein